ncbi:NAD(P)-dependent oxidoreductase [Candidatus Woesebacteria bacterium RIFCSPLOWO2_01_FULL_39_10b]|uniref:NAD(P)-dependent oxidoreductase n=1 Tax=Candidatus Woesebacteria bacterium RIFCSPLOWO2_01_FULL_39_10b TaxID=1802517 RepID=A0A1F8BBF3_9BACT|nr:MAG: NAD(P)-dependent oxidoreductase [Candidatus Woesebacteria bacterium RIFCSPLOWO2_01_FULL_39_10b]
MIIVDKELKKLQKSGKPIRVGMAGAGFMGKGIALQISKYTPGMELVAVVGRSVERAMDNLAGVGLKSVEVVDSALAMSRAIAKGKVAVVDNFELVTKSEQVDVVVEVTGAVDYGGQVVVSSLESKKPVLVMNSELDATLGPILKRYADEAGVIYSNTDGDQPGVIMNLYRFVAGIGIKPLVCGNIKGLHDVNRNPTTQKSFAEKWGQNVRMVTAFADGTKISFEQAVVANATGMRVARRGMHGFEVEAGMHIAEAAKFFESEEVLKGEGIVDYVVGATPAPGVFVLGTTQDDVQKKYLDLYKLGKGPLYLFYTPYHLCHFEVPTSIARAVLFNDATAAPIGGPMVEVASIAKISLKKGKVLDGIGGYDLYGVCENAGVARRENLLPVGLSGGCVLKKDIVKGQTITFDDVEVPEGRLTDKLWREQLEVFGKEKNEKN